MTFLGLLACIEGASLIINPPRRQAGYIITSRGNTILGIIQNIGQKRARFKPLGGLHFYKVNTDSIEVVVSPKRHLYYRAIELRDHSTQFVRRIDSGKISMYEWNYAIYKHGFSELYIFIKDKPVVEIYGENLSLDSTQHLLMRIANNEQALEVLKKEKKLSVDFIRKFIRRTNSE